MSECGGILPAPWGENLGPQTEPGGCRRPAGHDGSHWPTPLAADLTTAHRPVCSTELGTGCLDPNCPHLVCIACHEKWPCSSNRYLIQLGWHTPPLSLNDRLHRAHKAKITAEIRRDVLVLAKAAKLPKNASYVVVQLCYAPKDNRRRDTDNLVASAKPIYDALATDYGMVPDDTPQWMGKPEPIIYPKSTTGHGELWLEIAVTP